MMQVKYRAWDKITNDWYDDKNQHLVVGLDGEIMNCWNGELMDVYTDRISLIQYTGLKDKNGVEIYEGDVIASQNKDRDNWYVSHHEIVWYDTGFKGKQICSSSYIGLNYWTSGLDGYVVIGNIYENPELLEVSRN